MLLRAVDALWSMEVVVALGFGSCGGDAVHGTFHRETHSEEEKDKSCIEDFDPLCPQRFFSLALNRGAM